MSRAHEITQDVRGLSSGGQVVIEFYLIAAGEITTVR